MNPARGYVCSRYGFIPGGESKIVALARLGYNGDGPKARAYRQDVLDRVGGMGTLSVGND